MGKDVIIALRLPRPRGSAYAFLDQLHTSEKPFVKIGMELFYAEGPADRARDQARAATKFSSTSSSTTSPTPSKTAMRLAFAGWTWT